MPSLTKANVSMANPMQNKWVCDMCYTHVPDQSWEPLQLKEFCKMQAVAHASVAHAASYSSSRYNIS